MAGIGSTEFELQRQSEDGEWITEADYTADERDLAQSDMDREVRTTNVPWRVVMLEVVAMTEPVNPTR